MSVEMVVFMDPARMPSPERWAAAIREAGFDMALDTEFDVQSFSGFLPCVYKGVRAGFEYFYQSLADEPPEADVAAQIGSRTIAISFVTHSDLRDLVTSLIASGVLCAVADGVLLDTESNTFVIARDAVRWSKRGESETQDEL